MNEEKALEELAEVLGSELDGEHGEPEVLAEPEPEYQEGTCFECGAELSPIHDTQSENECQKCFYSRLTVAQRCDMVAESVMPTAAQWGESETLARLREAVTLACTLAESRDARLVGQWADGFMAGLVASGKLPANRAMTDATVAKLIADVNSNPIPTGD